METPGRLTSLDAFRGITIAGMILVNNPGSWAYVYPPLRHAEWHGCTPTDLVFPFFLFIVGVAISFSFSKHVSGGADRKQLHLKILKRALIIFGIGLFLNGFPSFNFGTIRIFGVLQRIALTYLLASLITLNTRPKGQALFAGCLLLFYWAVMKLVPVAGFGAGDLSMEGNLATFIDNALFKGHLWKASWDPEGVLSTLPATATVLCGVLTGHLLRSKRDKSDIANLIFMLGWAGIIAGLVWGIWFPINKGLWTSSYVLFTAGAALQFLGVCYWLIEVKGWNGWAKPAIVYGMNPLFVFIISILFVKTIVRIQVAVGGGDTTSLYAWTYRNIFASWLGSMNGSLAFAIANVLLWLAAAGLLYRKRIFIKV